MGATKRYSYATNGGAIAYIRVSDAAHAVDPSTPPSADPVDPNFYVSVSNSKRKQGITARHVTIGKNFPVTGLAGVNYTQKAKIACLTQAGYNTLAGSADGSISYKGSNGWRVVGATTEG